MATLHLTTREIAARVLYLGPAGAGSGTNVRRLYDLVSASSRSRLHKFGPKGVDERTWYFDYVPSAVIGIRDFQLRVHVYSLPSNIDVVAHRMELLREVDGLVFVADARADKETNNADQLLVTEAELTAAGFQLQALPVVMQINHTDHADARPVADVAFSLNPYGFPVVSACAREDRGVLEAHERVLQTIAERVRDALSGAILPVRLHATVLPEVERDDVMVLRHLAAIQRGGPLGATLESEEVVSTAEVADGGDVLVPFLPSAVVGYRPVHVSGARLVGDEVAVDVIVRNHRGDSVVVHVFLEARPSEASPVLPPPVGNVPSPVTMHLPASLSTAEPAADPVIPGWMWGLAGLAGGVVGGGLVAYLIAG